MCEDSPSRRVQLLRALPITVPDKRDRLAIVRTPMYARCPKDARRRAVQSRGATLFHHHVLRLDGKVQATRVGWNTEDED